MAIVQQTYSPHAFRLAIAQQSAFGTAHTTQTDFQELWLTNRPELTATPLIDETKRADGSTVHSILDRYVTQAGGEYTIAVEGVLTQAQAAFLLYGVLQVITSEGASDPWTKVFTLGAGVLPPSAPGFVFTTLIYDPAGNNIELQDCVFKTLTLSQSPGAQGGRITFSGTIYSMHAPDLTGVTATINGWDAPGTVYYGLSNLDSPQINVAGGGALDVVVYGWSLTVDNEAKGYGWDADGYAQGMAIASGNAGYSITGELVTKYDTNTKSALGDFLANSMLTIALPFNASSTTDLSFAINARHKSQPTKDFGNDAGVTITFPFEAVNNPTGPVSALVVTLDDLSDKSWTA